MSTDLTWLRHASFFATGTVFEPLARACLCTSIKKKEDIRRFFFFRGSGVVNHFRGGCWQKQNTARKLLKHRNRGITRGASDPESQMTPPAVTLRCTSSWSRSTVARPNVSLTKSPVSTGQFPIVSPEVRCPSTPRRHRSIDRPLHTRRYMDTFVFNGILPCIEQP